MKVMFSIAWALLSISIEAQKYPTEITVAKDGSGDFTTIQSAINSTKAFPDVPISIFISGGVYREKVRIYSWNTNLSLIGDSEVETVITYDDHFKKINIGRNSTFHTYTLKVEATDFYASNLTIENSAGDVDQAVALHVEADRVFFENCTFFGSQDTMYLAGEKDRVYFKGCFISGTTDFIFGSATALFNQCEIQSKKASYITAASTPNGVPYGFVFLNCNLTCNEVAKGSVFLGRPWRGYAKTVFINCEMADHIHPEGWKEWHSGGKVFYAEYGSTGAGSNSSKRVDWSVQLSKKQSKAYTIEKIFGDWLPFSQ